MIQSNRYVYALTTAEVNQEVNKKTFECDMVYSG